MEDEHDMVMQPQPLHGDSMHADKFEVNSVCLIGLDFFMMRIVVRFNFRRNQYIVGTILNFPDVCCRFSYSLLSFQYIKQEPVYAQSKFSAPTLAIAIGSVTVFVVIVVGIVVLRKRAQRVPSSRGFVEVDQAGSPEERHVANMQMNGYENPTYLYFEMNGNA